MFGFRRKDQLPIYGVLFDIGSGSIGVGIAESDGQKKLPRLLYTHRTSIRVNQHVVGTEINTRRVRESLLSISLTLLQEGMGSLIQHNPKATISRIFVTCSSPWSHTVARNVQYENNDPFKVTPSLISDLVNSAEVEILNELENETDHENIEDFDIVERITVDININDYPVRNPFSLTGTSLGLSHVIGLIPKKIIESVEEVRHKLYPETEIKSHTYMLVMYCVLREILPRVNSLCIIDVTAEATEFGIVENNLLIQNVFTSSGTNTFVRSVMNKTNKPATDIQTSINLYSESSQDILSEYKESVTEYTEAIKSLIERVREHRTLPKNIIITAQKPFHSLFKEMLTRSFKKELGNDLQIVTFETTMLDEISQGAGDDVYLALGARFFHKLHGCGDID